MKIVFILFSFILLFSSCGNNHTSLENSNYPDTIITRFDLNRVAVEIYLSDSVHNITQYTTDPLDRKKLYKSSSEKFINWKLNGKRSVFNERGVEIKVSYWDNGLQIGCAVERYNIDSLNYPIKSKTCYYEDGSGVRKFHARYHANGQKSQDTLFYSREGLITGAYNSYETDGELAYTSYYTGPTIPKNIIINPQYTIRQFDSIKYKQLAQDIIKANLSTEEKVALQDSIDQASPEEKIDFLQNQLYGNSDFLEEDSSFFSDPSQVGNPQYIKGRK